MARTTQQIYTAIITEKETLSSLDALTPNPETVQDFIAALATQSKVAIWRLSAWVFAFMAHILETLWDVKEQELIDIRDTTPPHTRLWWERAIKAFQYGDATIVDEFGKVTYEVIDEDKQIVSRVNVKNLVPTGILAGDAISVNVRVVKFEDPDYVQFDAGEQAAFDAYVEEIKPLGVKTNVAHNDGGLIRWEGKIWIDPTIIDHSMQLLSDLDVNVLDDAMTDYIDNWAMVNSKLNENVMIDYILNAPGVIDVVIDSHKWRETPLDSFVAVLEPVFLRKELEIDSVAATWDNNNNLFVTAENVVN